ncbi:hypothetical protein EfmJHP36_24500 [Enterococcus faecium]|nr:hypothetical protein EfmJHP36_24500 [Enterococcus faecium]
MYKTKLLNQLDSLELEEINQGIAELENNIGKTYFGNSFNEKLTVLYCTHKTCRTQNNLSRNQRAKKSDFNRMVKHY